MRGRRDQTDSESGCTPDSLLHTDQFPWTSYLTLFS